MAAIDHDVTFRHQPLPGKGYIRLIEVLDINNEGVRCQLTCWPIGSAPPYDAISYTWGDPNLRTSITINDRRLEVTQNCEYVLRQARWHRGSRYHWVDAICIDQQDNLEKSEQVARMGAIYKAAQRVLACVGDHDNASRIVMAICMLQKHAGSLLLMINPRSRQEKARRWLENLMPRLIFTQSRLAKALLAFGQRPYFRRLWVLQELFHGRTIDLCCGSDHGSFEQLLDLYDLSDFLQRLREMEGFWRIDSGLRLKDRRCKLTPAPGVTYVACMSIKETLLPHLKILRFTGTARRAGTTLSDAMTSLELSDFVCQDPRDKIYGILSMIKWGKLNPIQPDYSKGLLSLYFEVIKTIGQEERWWWKYYFAANQTLKTLGLMGSSLQELVDHGVVSADVIEIRQSPWSEVANSNIGNSASRKRVDGGHNELSFYFGDCGWQLGEPWKSASPETAFLDLPELVEWEASRFLMKLILTQQGQACLVCSNPSIELGASILKVNGPEFSCDVGPVVMGIVMEKQPDGRSQIVGNAMIRELGDYVLKYEEERFKGTIVTKGVCRDGSDQPVIVELGVVNGEPWYGMKKTWEDYIKDSQKHASGGQVD